MQSHFSSENVVKFAKTMRVSRQIMLAAAISLFAGYSSVVAASDDEHEMHNSMHEHGMDHSMHEQQLSRKGSYTKTVVSYALPDIKLVDMNGETVSLRETLNSDTLLVVNFIYTTCPTICPVMTSSFQQVQAKLGSKHHNVRLISISIDPENDTPGKLGNYAGKYKAGPQWKFLTGTFDNSILVQQAFGTFAGEKMNHRPATFLKAQGSENEWVRLDGLTSASDIVKEIDMLGIHEHMH